MKLIFLNVGRGASVGTLANAVVTSTLVTGAMTIFIFCYVGCCGSRWAGADVASGGAALDGCCADAGGGGLSPPLE